MGTEISFWLNAFLSPFDLLASGWRLPWQPLESWSWALRLKGQRERALPLRPFLFAWHWAGPPGWAGTWEALL